MTESKLTFKILKNHLILVSYAFNCINLFFSGLIKTMETLNSEDPVDLWESWDDHGKLHIDYDVCVDMFTLSIYGAQGSEECIIVSLKTVFVSYHEQALYNSFPML
jgi:hypothetical protein